MFSPQDIFDFYKQHGKLPDSHLYHSEDLEKMFTLMHLENHDHKIKKTQRKHIWKDIQSKTNLRRKTIWWKRYTIGASSVIAASFLVFFVSTFDNFADSDKSFTLAPEDIDVLINELDQTFNEENILPEFAFIDTSSGNNIHSKSNESQTTETTKPANNNINQIELGFDHISADTPKRMTATRENTSNMDDLNSTQNKVYNNTDSSTVPFESFLRKENSKMTFENNYSQNETALDSQHNKNNDHETLALVEENNINISSENNISERQENRHPENDNLDNTDTQSPTNKQNISNIQSDAPMTHSIDDTQNSELIDITRVVKENRTNQTDKDSQEYINNMNENNQIDIQDISTPTNTYNENITENESLNSQETKMLVNLSDNNIYLSQDDIQNFENLILNTYIDEQIIDSLSLFEYIQY